MTKWTSCVESQLSQPPPHLPLQPLQLPPQQSQQQLPLQLLLQQHQLQPLRPQPFQKQRNSNCRNQQYMVGGFIMDQAKPTPTSDNNVTKGGLINGGLDGELAISEVNQYDGEEDQQELTVLGISLPVLIGAAVGAVGLLLLMLILIICLSKKKYVNSFLIFEGFLESLSVVSSC